MTVFSFSYRVCLGRCALLCSCLLAMLLGAGPTSGQPGKTGENLALGKKYTLEPRPNYQYCTDPDDNIQLTDGQSTTAYFWTQKGTVGWNHVPYASITVDLGVVQPIGGVGLVTAAGKATVSWPRAIEILVSDDGKQFRAQGDLVQLHQHARGPLPADYAILKLQAPDLKTRGRFVRFLMLPQGTGYLFVDEVEVYRGAPSLANEEPTGAVVDDVKAWVRQKALQRGIRARWDADLGAVRQAVEKERLLDASLRNRLLERLRRLGHEIEKAETPVAADFRAVLPIGPQHAELFQVQAELWKGMGRAPWTAWTVGPWDPLELIALPPEKSGGQIQVNTMLQETRAAAVNVAFCGEKPAGLKIRFEGLPGAPRAGYVGVHEALWTDTSAGRPVAAALPELLRDMADWTTTVTPGLVHQLWFSFRVAGVAPGSYEGSLVLEPEGSPLLRIPVRLRVWPLTFPTQATLWVGGWCYTNDRGSNSVTSENRRPLVRHLQTRLVNCPWASGHVLMQFEVESKAPLRIKLNTRSFDEWRQLWHDARCYMVFLSAGDTMAGVKAGTPEFDRLVGAWISAWVKHLLDLGVSSRQLAILLQDEPHEGSDIRPTLAWAKAIHAAEPRVLVWVDPTYRDPTKAPPELFKAVDVLSPNRPMWLENEELFSRFYGEQGKQGRTLQFYSCSGPAQVLDPYSYYRLQAWHAWHIGGIGSFFWSFSDASGPSTWNPYQALGGPYSPAFLDPLGVTPGKHMEAVRESAQDYEYLVMLSKAVDRARILRHIGPAVDQARLLLTNAAEEVLAVEGVKKISWFEPKDRSAADAARVKLLDALVALEGKKSP